MNIEKATKAYVKELGEVELIFLKQVQLFSKTLILIQSTIANQEFTRDKVKDVMIERVSPTKRRNKTLRQFHLNFLKMV